MSKGITLQELDVSISPELFPHLGTTTNSGNDYTVVTKKTVLANQKFTVKFNVASTGEPTLKFNNGTAYAIKKTNGSAAKLYASIYTLFFDGSVFILLGEGGTGNASTDDVELGKTFTNDDGEQVGTRISYAVNDPIPISKLSAAKWYKSFTLDLSGATYLLTLPEQKIYYRWKSGNIERVGFDGTVLGQIAAISPSATYVLPTYDKTHFIEWNVTTNTIRKVRLSDNYVQWSITVTDQTGTLRMIGGANSHDFAIITTSKYIRKYNGMTGAQSGQFIGSAAQTQHHIGRNIFAYVEGAGTWNCYIRIYNMDTMNLLSSDGPISNTGLDSYSDQYSIAIASTWFSLVDLFSMGFTSYGSDTNHGWFVDNNRTDDRVAARDGSAPRSIAYNNVSTPCYGCSPSNSGSSIYSFDWAEFGGLAYFSSGCGFIPDVSGTNATRNIQMVTLNYPRNVAIDPKTQTLVQKSNGQSGTGNDVRIYNWDGSNYIPDPNAYQFVAEDGTTINSDYWFGSDGTYLHVKDASNTNLRHLFYMYPSRKITA
ncbi:hypothetical protein ACFQ3W_11365 [Paenibacillus puldeungensis]|uniref:Uncharacterized protein n=1 Tax=Paenibacillus puldeungensis TaxID=696536 RepID=A0ABW3RXN3_9BACL